MNLLSRLIRGRRALRARPPNEVPSTRYVGWNFSEEGDGNAKLFLLDRTGSMVRGNAYRDMVAGVNAALERDRGDPLARTAHTLVARFDSMGFDPIRNARMADVLPLTERELEPRALTPLNDAIGHAVDQVLEQPQRGRKILAIFTDGEENDSKKYADLRLLRERIRLFEERGNIIVFLAANLDAQEAGERFGIPPQRCLNTRANGRPGTSSGLMACFLAAGALGTTLLFASSAATAATLGFTEDDRKASMGGVDDWPAAVAEDIASMDSAAESAFGLHPDVVRDIEALPQGFDPAGGSIDMPGSANYEELGAGSVEEVAASVASMEGVVSPNDVPQEQPAVERVIHSPPAEATRWGGDSRSDGGSDGGGGGGSDGGSDGGGGGE